MADSLIKENLMPKRSRIKYKPDQVELLERAFDVNHYPDTLQQEQLADKLNVTIDRVSIWFQNRRSKFKRQRQADHVSWMRKQIFQENENVCKNAPGTPKLPALMSACHVLSPLESQVPRDETAEDASSSSPEARSLVTAGADKMDAYSFYPPTSYSHGPTYFTTPTRPHPGYNMVPLTGLQQFHTPFYDIFPQISPAMTSLNIPSMHSIAQSHMTRSRLEMTKGVTLLNQHIPTCHDDVKDHLSCHGNKVSGLDENKFSPSAASNPNFGWLDSDSDSSPSKDRTLECLAQWC